MSYEYFITFFENRPYCIDFRICSALRLGRWCAHVNYDPTTGKITLKTENTELAEALSLVSNKTGVWICIAPSIEKSITIELTNTPLENALRRFAKKLNHVMFYESSQDGPHHLVGMNILSGGSDFGTVAISSGLGVTRTYTGSTGGFSSIGNSPGRNDSTMPSAVRPGSASTNVVHMDDKGSREKPLKKPADVAEMDESPAARKIRARRRGRLEH